MIGSNSLTGGDNNFFRIGQGQVILSGLSPIPFQHLLQGLGALHNLFDLPGLLLVHFADDFLFSLPQLTDFFVQGPSNFINFVKHAKLYPAPLTG